MMRALLDTLKIPMLALALSAAAMPATSFAQNAPRTPRVQGNRAGGRAQPGQQIQQILEQLNLSDEQKEKIKPIVEDLRKQLRDAIQNASAPDQRREQVREATAAARKQIGEILTPEQRAKMAEMIRAQRGATSQPTTQSAAGGGMVGRIEAIALGLDLTPEQQTKVKDLSKEYRDEVAAMIRDNAGAKGGAKEMRTVIQEYRSRLTQLLTPEQTDQFNKKLEALRPAGAAAAGAQTARQGKHAKRAGKTA